MSSKLEIAFKKLPLYKRNIISKAKIVWPMMFVLFVLLKPFFAIAIPAMYLVLYSFLFATCFTFVYICINFLLLGSLKDVKNSSIRTIVLYIIYMLIFIAVTFCLMMATVYVLSFLFPVTNSIFIFNNLHNSFLLSALVEVLQIVVFFHLFAYMFLLHRGGAILIDNADLSKEDFINEISTDTNELIHKHAHVGKNAKKKIKINSKKAEVKDLIIHGLNKNERLAINSNSLVYVKSEGHYIKIYYFEEVRNKKVIKFSLIRNSIKNIEKAVTVVSPIVRTHKSYIINLTHINYIRCNMRKGMVSIKDVNIKLPIGKTYMDFLVSYINRVHPEVRLFT